MPYIKYIFFSMVCIVATTAIFQQQVKSETNTTPLGFQFFTSDNIPIPNETFQIQLDSKVETLTTKSDGLAFIHLPTNQLKPTYVITTANQQTFTVEPNKIYKLTSNSNKISPTPSPSQDSISVYLLSETYQPLNNVEVKLIQDNQVFKGYTDKFGQATIQVSNSTISDVAFEVWIQDINTNTTMTIGEEKYYSLDNKNNVKTLNASSTTPSVSNQTANTEQTHLTPNNALNTQQTFQISVAKDNLISSITPSNSKKTNNKQTDDENKKDALPNTGEKNNSLLKYIIVTLLLCISIMIFIILRVKRKKAIN